jgi:hypothetical protein
MCSHGTECRYAESHVPSVSAEKSSAVVPVAPVPKKVVAQQSTVKPTVGKAASTMFTTHLQKFNGESEDEDVGCVRVCKSGSGGAESDDEACMSAGTVSSVGKSSAVLCWDTGSSIHVANALDVLDDGGRPVRRSRDAVGVGGARPITHCGQSSVFNGLEMSFIKGGGTPNLLSVGRVLQQDESGLPGLAIFSATGAVHCRVTPVLTAKFTALLNEIESEDLMEGTAVMNNHVYEEQFG